MSDREEPEDCGAGLGMFLGEWCCRKHAEMYADGVPLIGEEPSA